MSNAIPAEQLAAIILCGGRNKRMGFPKSRLPLNRGETFLSRIVRSLQDHVGTVVVVNPFGSPPEHQERVQFTQDRRPDCGPMEGISSGLNAVRDQFSAAFVTSCDVPLIRPEIIHHLAQQLGQYDGVTLVDGQRVYGLTALYRTSIQPTLDQLIQDNELKISNLSQHLQLRQIPVDSIRSMDPDLESLTNINSPEDYRQLADKLGFDIPEELMEQLRSQSEKKTSG